MRDNGHQPDPGGLHLANQRPGRDCTSMPATQEVRVRQPRQCKVRDPVFNSATNPDCRNHLLAVACVDVAGFGDVTSSALPPSILVKVLVPTGTPW